MGRMKDLVIDMLETSDNEREKPLNIKEVGLRNKIVKVTLNIEIQEQLEMEENER